MRSRSLRPLSLGLLLSSAWLLGSAYLSPQLLARAQENGPSAQTVAVPRVNAPYDVPDPEAAVFWFGRVGLTENYTDVRISYDQTGLFVHVAIFDRRLWYDKDPSPDDLTNWDAVTLYLSRDGNTGNRPGANAYRFAGQLKWWEERDEYQAAYRGDGSDWVPADIDFVTKSDWRSDDNAPIDDLDDKGWWLQYLIPFDSLGLDGPPAQGTVWGLAVAVHDRDDEANTSTHDTLWPATMDAGQPATWGQLVFGLPAYTPPPAIPEGTTTIRHGLNGATVMDADVGGSSVCGEAASSDFADWGALNYAGKDFLNIQNQGDVADWPCFSKYYVAFPLDSIPAGAPIVSATLTLYLWGGAGDGWDPGPQPSMIQVLSVAEDWNEAAITWNNAPLAQENISATLVEPVDEYAGRPGIPYDWDVSRAVAMARASGSPLRLAMYESDWAYHSGKYFDTSDVGDWGAEGRPTLKVTWGAPVDTPYSIYLPHLLRAAR